MARRRLRTPRPKATWASGGSLVLSMGNEPCGPCRSFGQKIGANHRNGCLPRSLRRVASGTPPIYRRTRRFLGDFFVVALRTPAPGQSLFRGC
jgi:hypothetical protein